MSACERSNRCRSLRKFMFDVLRCRSASGSHADLQASAEDHERISSYSLCSSGGGSTQEVEPIFCDCVYPVTAAAGWFSL